MQGEAGGAEDGRCRTAFRGVKERTAHCEVDLFLQRRLLLQCLLGQLGGARETHQDDAHVVQASLWTGGGV